MPSRPETSVRREALLAELRRAGGRPLSLPDLMQRARIHPGARQEAKRLARELVREGLVARVGRRLALPRAATGDADRPGVEGGEAGRGGRQEGGGRGAGRGEGGAERARRPGGTAPERPPQGLASAGLFTRHRDGFGFLARLDRRGPDLFVAPGDGGRALDGDLVRYEVIAGRRGPQGRVVEVLQRGRRMVVGALQGGGDDASILPLDRELPPVSVDATGAAAPGDVVKAWLLPSTGRLSGRVAERVRDPGAPSTEVLRVAYAKGFADLFPDEVLDQAEAVPDRVRPQDREGRRDLTRLRLVTIDGEDARDFDDAVHVERLSGRRGWRLVVAIADVSHYVRAGSPLDAEAMRRGTSVYFPGTVLPMLPERLSNGICSLNPEVERLCMVADLQVGPQGEPGGTEIYPAVMRSAARCTYAEVARMLEGDRVPHREFLRADVEQMAELQQVLTAMRRRRGAMDFDLPEAKVLLGDGGEVLAIERRPRNRAHRVVEEFMLAANEAVARWFGERELPTIYRVHGLPDEEKLRIFLDLARAQGLDVPEVDAGPRALAELLDRLEGNPQQRALNQLLLRAMMQAVYSPENIGHYGLGAGHYLHFTSPIRRYPDLLVHRLLREAGRWGGARDGRAPRPEELERIALLASQRERAAMEAERDVHAFHAARFMGEHVGERSRATVAAVTDFGLFASLERWFVEGLIRAEDLGDGFALDPAGHALVEARSGRAYRVGDALEVEVASADPVLRRIDLLLVEGGVARARSERGPAGRPGASRRGGRREGPAGEGGGRGRKRGSAGEAGGRREAGPGAEAPGGRRPGRGEPGAGKGARPGGDARRKGRGGRGRRR